MKRISRVITNPVDINFLLSITEEQGSSMSFICENFGSFGDQPPRFFPYDKFTVPIGSYGPEGRKNKNNFVTTVGRWVFNKVFIEKDLFDLFGYINKSIDNDVFDDLNKEMSYAVLEDRISLEVLKDYTTKTQKFQPYCSILAPSVSIDCMEIPSKIRKLKAELFKKYEKELAANDPITSKKIEDILLDECKKILKDDEFMDLIRSKCRIKFDNNFKAMYVFKGAVREADPTKGGFTIIKSNFSEGISPEDYADFANSLTGGPYSRAVKTQTGGALEKQMVRAFQHIRALPEGTDCGTKRYLQITFDKKNIKDWLYSYIIEPNGLVELTSQNMDKYIGKTVKLRYAAMCEHKKGICSKCAGHLFNRLGLSEVGIASYQLASVIKNKSMKAFHDSSVRIVDVEKYGLDKVFGLND